MGQMFTAQFNNVAVTAVQDLFELVAPSTGAVLIHEIGLSQSSDVGDAAEEILRILLISGYTVSGSGGSSVTPVPLQFGGTAFGGTCEANNTTVANTGTPVTHYAWSWNERMPFQHIFTPESRPILSASRRAVLNLPAAPADSITMSGYIVFEVIGG